MMKFKSCIYPHIPLIYLCLNSIINPFFALRGPWLRRQSARLITVRSWVRIPAGPLHFFRLFFKFQNYDIVIYPEDHSKNLYLRKKDINMEQCDSGKWVKLVIYLIFFTSFFILNILKQEFSGLISVTVIFEVICHYYV